MAEDLQGLLDRIQNDGIKKAEMERDTMIADAKAQAEKIIADAKAQAEKIVADAKAQAQDDEKRANETIRQAARDTINTFKADLLARLQRVTKDMAGQAMTPALMADIIRTMAAAYAEKSAAGLEILLPEKDAAALEAGLKAALLNNIKTEASGITAGLKIGFNGSDEYLDFSDDALTDVICEFVGPKLAALLKG